MVNLLSALELGFQQATRIVVDKFTMQASVLAQQALPHEAQPFGHAHAGRVAGSTARFDAVEAEWAETPGQHGLQRFRDDAPACELTAQEIGDARFRVAVVDVFQAHRAAQAVSHE